MTIDTAVELTADEMRRVEQTADALGYATVSDFIRHTLGLVPRAPRAKRDSTLEALCGL